MPLTQDDLRTDDQLRNDGFNQDEIAEFRNAAGIYFSMLADLDEANETQDYERVLDIEAQVPVIEARLLYQGKLPRDVPLDVMRGLLKVEREDRDVQVYAQRVKNPATAIRAKCIEMMGGQPGEVRRCETATCHLWMFRMGSNPLFGKVLPPVEKEIVLEDDDVVEIEEEVENVDAD